MPSVPCTTGQMGSNRYYQTTMKARDFTMIARPAKEMDGWASMGLEERIQRELNAKRVSEEIAPYLAKSSDRFFGSIIVLMYDAEVDFESLLDVAPKLPKAYQQSVGNFGFLHINGGELIVLDGQHRYAAFREVIQGDTDGEFSGKIANDDVSVIFINHESNEKTRRIFNKLNRQAKSLSRGDNLIMSEDDGYAIVTRRLLEVSNGPLGVQAGKDLIVNWKSNTIAARSSQLTTINTVYETVKEILLADSHDFNFDEKVRQVRPEEQELCHAYEVVEVFWSHVLDAIPVYKEALSNPAILKEERVENRPYSLLLKPVGQVALFKALVKLESNGFLHTETLKNIGHIDFRINNELWDNVLVRAGNKMLAGKDGIDITSEMIAFYLEPKAYSEHAKQKVEARIANAKGIAAFEL